MLHETFSWKTPQGVNIFAQKWLPEGEVRAIVALVHGHGEHSGRYAHVAEYLCQKGIGLYAFDQIGHGKSGGKKGYTPGYDVLLDNTSELLRKVRERYGETPIFLYGHSMGGNLVASHALRRKPPIRGVILSAPWLRLAFQPSAMDITLAKMMIRVFPKFTQSSGLDTAAISRDPEEVKKYEQDPLIHSKIGPPMFLGVTEAGEWALAHAHEFALPLLHMHGTADRITSFEASKAFASKASGDITWKAWEGYFHELHNEPETERLAVLELVGDWILQRS